MVRKHAQVWLAALAALTVPACAKADEQPARKASLVLADVRKPDIVPAYLLICPQKAVAEVMPLAKWRSGHGQTVRIATAETIYKAFGNGRASAKSIRDFLHSLAKLPAAPARPKFLLLVGTGDRRNAEGMYLPTWITRARFYSTEMPSDKFLAGDYLYATPAGSGVPDVAVGRLPARSLGDLRVMVRKTLACERGQAPGQWRRRADVFAGPGGFGRMIDAVLERFFSIVLADHAPNYLNCHLSYANPASAYCYAPSRFSDHMVDRLNAGPALMFYIGHGSEKGFDRFTWKGQTYPILNSSAVKAIRIPHHRTIVVALACSTGRFDGAEASVGERLLASPAGPAIFVGSSRISQPYANAILGAFLTEALLEAPPPTVGQAFLQVQKWFARGRRTGFRTMVDLLAATQLGFAALSDQRADQIMLYNLLGDPALSLPVVRERAALSAPAAAWPGQTIEVRMTGPVKTGTAHFSLTIRRDRTLRPVAAVPEDRPGAEAEMIRTNARANNKVVVENSVRITEGKAAWSVRIPADCPAGEFHINVYAQGQQHDAAGSREISIQGPEQ